MAPDSAGAKYPAATPGGVMAVTYPGGMQWQVGGVLIPVSEADIQ
jgi:hypothetical protein